MSDHFDWLFDATAYETTETLPAPAVHRSKLRREFRAARKREQAAEIFTDIIPPGTALHIVANGKFDFWSVVPVLCGLLGPGVDLAASTWVMNRANVVELLGMLDDGRLIHADILTGIYFRRRDSSVYAMLVEGFHDRPGKARYLAFENHTKVPLLRKDDARLVIEGSANFTGNPRLEQYVMTNDAKLYEFHRAWMSGMLAVAVNATGVTP